MNSGFSSKFAKIFLLYNEIIFLTFRIPTTSVWLSIGILLNPLWAIYDIIFSFRSSFYYKV